MHKASMRDRYIRNKRNFRQRHLDHVDTEPNTRPREELKIQPQSPVQANIGDEAHMSMTVMNSNRDQQLPPPHDMPHDTPSTPSSQPLDSLPLPPSKDSLKSKDKSKHMKGKERLKSEESGSPNDSPNRLDVAPWTDIMGPRRPSTVTLDDSHSFARGLRHVGPNLLRRNEWSFIRNPERVSFPSREPNSSRRYWDVWRCSQIGQIRVERVTFPPPCTYVSVPTICIC